MSNDDARDTEAVKRPVRVAEVVGANREKPKRTGNTDLGEAVAPAPDAKDVFRVCVVASEDGNPTAVPPPPGTMVSGKDEE